ncbi:LysR family transcriptional regulator [Algimonas arctica]|uniref:LysR family transcriptional regulator n=1 Tax=Algimonas arctica TaxID=1479486 RepID=A0A8J3CU65_9PROT|nr:LysR family transcriptional regulator [Algimonas arctica]GHB02143.1 LysR family transcriptional regulator [Algimonas arctica]
MKLNDGIVYIHIMNLRLLDLNLLVVFDALMRERHVTRAAQSIGLSQPAFSNALTRLRDRLGDELFIRAPDGMKPTPWALELSGPISTSLSEIENALDGASFDPATSKRAFTIATPDYATITLFPKLLERMRKTAPGVVLQIITPSRHIGEYLDTQKADIALLNWADTPERFVSEPLFAENWVCVMRPEHPMVGQRPTLARYSSAGHLLVNPMGERRNWVDEALADRGHTRHVAYAMPTYGPAPLILETTDLILTCPASVAKVYEEKSGMFVSTCPVATPPSVRSIDMVWHSRLGNHPAQSWLRNLLRDASNTFGA